MSVFDCNEGSRLRTKVLPAQEILAPALACALRGLGALGCLLSLGVLSCALDLTGSIALAHLLCFISHVIALGHVSACKVCGRGGLTSRWSMLVMLVEPASPCSPCRLLSPWAGRRRRGVLIPQPQGAESPSPRLR
ncbi:hypothetical protein HaLaN_20276 [Haematococcus lacustris]|uniref:Uncharacterized protein n=1 Tax=Haematococcus lacustris TaxID=44745 RepID=A0A699ZVR2_HAELA|nr:hypothetical protein HaLaN_20276 [Haematococcus lacustris]